MKSNALTFKMVEEELGVVLEKIIGVAFLGCGAFSLLHSDAVIAMMSFPLFNEVSTPLMGFAMIIGGLKISATAPQILPLRNWPVLASVLNIAFVLITSWQMYDSFGKGVFRVVQ